MSGRIRIVYRIIVAIRIAVEVLGVVGIRDYRVGLGEAAQVGGVVSGAVEVEAGGGVFFLAGVFVVGGLGAVGDIGFAVGVIL